MEGLIVSPAKMGTKMGMLKGEVVGEAMAVKIAEIGAQGAPCTFAIVSRDDSGGVSVCEGSYGYMLGDGTVFEGDVRGRDLEKAIPAIERTGIARPFSMVRGHFRFEASDGTWLHMDTGFGNHFLLRDSIGRDFLDRFRGQEVYAVYEHGVAAVSELLQGNALSRKEK